MERDEAMDECMREVENCLTRLEALEREANAIMEKFRHAEHLGEVDTCRICGKKWLAVRATIRLLNEQVERTLMFRLPPTSRHPRCRVSLPVAVAA
ncbi:hypothetical protein CDEF62S_04507 [Castellaniella defragrans]